MKVSCVTGNIHIRNSYTFSQYITIHCNRVTTATNNYFTSARGICDGRLRASLAKMISHQTSASG